MAGYSAWLLTTGCQRQQIQAMRPTPGPPAPIHHVPQVPQREQLSQPPRPGRHRGQPRPRGSSELAYTATRFTTSQDDNLLRDRSVTRRGSSTTNGCRLDRAPLAPTGTPVGYQVRITPQVYATP